jgi:hypothetical protein
MKLSTLLAIIFLAMLGSALAFIFYVPVLTIFSTTAVLLGMLGAFGVGLMVGRRGRYTAMRRPAVVVPIDEGIADRPVMMLNRGVR